MDAPVGNNPTVVNFKRICVEALKDSKLTLAGHVSSKAFQSALNTVISTRTGISIFGLVSAVNLNLQNVVPRCFLVDF